MINYLYGDAYVLGIIMLISCNISSDLDYYYIFLRLLCSFSIRQIEIFIVLADLDINRYSNRGQYLISVYYRTIISYKQLRRFKKLA